MAANSDPIFSRVGGFQSGGVFKSAIIAPTTDFTGQDINNNVIFTADPTNGSFVQRLRFKALGTNAATVMRLFINNGVLRLASVITAPSGTPTGTPSASGGSLKIGTYFLKVVAIDQYGGQTAASTESASVTTTNDGASSISWTCSAVTGAASYKFYVGPVTGGQASYFVSATNTYTQTTAIGQRDSLNGSILNNFFFGEVSLPATTLSVAAGTPDIDYPINFAMPPGYRIIGGLGTTVAGGWVVTAIYGDY
jgi:hypothetical protein